MCLPAPGSRKRGRSRRALAALPRKEEGKERPVIDHLRHMGCVHGPCSTSPPERCCPRVLTASTGGSGDTRGQRSHWGHPGLGNPFSSSLPVLPELTCQLGWGALLFRRTGLSHCLGDSSTGPGGGLGNLSSLVAQEVISGMCGNHINTRDCPQHHLHAPCRGSSGAA